MVNLILDRLKSEPAIVVGVLVAAIVLVAGNLGIVLDEAGLTEVLTPLVVGLLTRGFVVPVKTQDRLDELAAEEFPLNGE